MESRIVSLLTTVLEMDYSPPMTISLDEFESTDDLGPAGNLLKLLIRHSCGEGGKDRANEVVRTVHKLSGSKR